MVIGYTDKSFIGASDEVDQRIWYYLAKQCHTVKKALELAKRDYLRHWGEGLFHSKHIDKLGFVGDGGTRIVHAFS